MISLDAKMKGPRLRKKPKGTELHCTDWQVKWLVASMRKTLPGKKMKSLPYSVQLFAFQQAFKEKFTLQVWQKLFRFRLHAKAYL